MRAAGRHAGGAARWLGGPATAKGSAPKPTGGQIFQASHAAPKLGRNKRLVTRNKVVGSQIFQASHAAPKLGRNKRLVTRNKVVGSLGPDGRLKLLSAEAHYNLKCCDDPDIPGRVLVTWTAEDTYRLKNMDRKKRRHDVEMEVDLPVGLEKHWDIRELQINGAPIPVQLQRGDGKLRLSHGVWLEPQQEMNIKTLQTGAGSLEYSEIICSALPADRLVVSAVFDDQLEVKATSLHPNECEAKTFHQKREWSLDGVLPGQGIEIFWEKQIKNSDRAHVTL